MSGAGGPLRAEPLRLALYTHPACAGHDPVDLVRASWREEPLTPDHLEHADQVVAVQLALVPAHLTPPTPPARVPAGTTPAGVSR